MEKFFPQGYKWSKNSFKSFIELFRNGFTSTEVNIKKLPHYPYIADVKNKLKISKTLLDCSD